MHSWRTLNIWHRAVLTLTYDSGCRVQELCDLTIGYLSPGTNPTVRLHGKGDKYRTVVISSTTSNLLESYISRCRKNALRNHPLITNRYNQKLDRDGVSYMVHKYSDEIRKKDFSFPEKVHCHMFRHSKGMHTLAAGINIVYIRDFLGHENISVTMVYAKADNRLKEAVTECLSMFHFQCGILYIEIFRICFREFCPLLCIKANNT